MTKPADWGVGVKVKILKISRKFCPKIFAGNCADTGINSKDELRKQEWLRIHVDKRYCFTNVKRQEQ